MKASELIREAKAVLFERGWHQGQWLSKDGAVCARGAMNIAMTGNALLYTTKSMVADAFISDATQHPCLVRWNDTTGRTFDDVIDALDKAEKLALIAEESDV